MMVKDKILQHTKAENEDEHAIDHKLSETSAMW